MEQTLRLAGLATEAAEATGPTETPAAKPKRASRAKAKAASPAPQEGKETPAKPAPKKQHDTTAQYAGAGVVLMSAMSGVLNGYANAQYAPIPVMGWLMGLSIPVIILILGKVAGNKYQKKHFAVAKFAAASGLSLLLLSVWHCSESIAALTGSGLVLAIPMAIAIDCGLVACEIAVITEKEKGGVWVSR